MKRGSIESLISAFSVALLIVAVSVGTSQGAQGSTSAVDLQFIDLMMMHHQDAIDMSKMVDAKGQSKDVKQFSAKLIDDQSNDLKELQGYRNRFYAGQPKAESMPMEKKSMSMAEMKRESEKNMSQLKFASGVDFDHTFLTIMTNHHQEGIDMAQHQIARGEHQEVKDFSRRLIAKQTEDSREMERMMGQMGHGKDGSPHHEHKK